MVLMALARPTFKFIFTATLGTRRCCVAELHGEANAFASHIDFSHFNFDDVASLHHFTCVGDELVAELTHVNQTILVNA